MSFSASAAGEHPTAIDMKDRLLERSLVDDPLTNPKTFTVPTRHGVLTVTQQGPSERTVIVTFHDVGFNSATQFHHFFSFTEMMPITQKFTIYHINAPGQEDRAPPLSPTTVYPTMEQLAQAVDDVFLHFEIKSAVCFGVGLGANVLARFALFHPVKVHGLILVNCVSRAVGWLEGFSIKWPSQDIAQQSWTESILSYLIWHHLGSETQTTHLDLVQTLRRHLEENVNARNVIKLLNAYFKRTPILMERPSAAAANAVPARTLKCSVMNVTGFSSPHKDDVVDTNDKCDPALSSLVEFSDCGGAILEEQPAKMAESIRLFLQGLGYLSHLSIPRYSIAGRLAEQTAEFKRRNLGLTDADAPRRLSAPFDSFDSGLYQRVDSEGDDDDNDAQGTIYENELQLRVDSFDDRQVKL